MVYNGNPTKIILGVPLFQETSLSKITIITIPQLLVKSPGLMEKSAISHVPPGITAIAEASAITAAAAAAGSFGIVVGAEGGWGQL